MILKFKQVAIKFIFCIFTSVLKVLYFKWFNRQCNGCCLNYRCYKVPDSHISRDDHLI